MLYRCTVSDRHQKYTYLFPFHAKRARVRVRVAVRFGSLSVIIDRVSGIIYRHRHTLSLRASAEAGFLILHYYI